MASWSSSYVEYKFLISFYFQLLFSLQVSVACDITPRNLVQKYHRFGGTVFGVKDVLFIPLLYTEGGNRRSP
jgi:hypothetical protein